MEHNIETLLESKLNKFLEADHRDSIWLNQAQIFEALDFLEQQKENLVSEELNDICWTFLNKVQDRSRTRSIQRKVLKVIENFPTSDMEDIMPRVSPFCGPYKYKVHKRIKSDLTHYCRIWLKEFDNEWHLKNKK